MDALKNIFGLEQKQEIDIGTMKRILRKIERDKYEKKIDYVLKQLDNINISPSTPTEFKISK